MKLLDFHGVQLPVCTRLECVDGQFLCMAGMEVPFGCTTYSPTPDTSYPYCAVKFEPLNAMSAPT
jgi:hypothetical protein